jgi:allophanate hydrolase
MTLDVLHWTVADHLLARESGVSARAVIDAMLAALDALDDPSIIIGAPLADLARADADRLDAEDMRAYPLHGIPFVVKDNIDVAGVPTTCACPSFAYIPTADALVVARLRAAGAIPVAKTNLDQFATGLVGVRSPHGTPRNPLHPDLVPGGSSSGSAVAVSRGLVPFSLGTDTAGSGRVPAALCGIIGLKPTVGRLPSLGVVPAVRRIDCVSVFARRVDDARLVADLASGPDAADPFTRHPTESIGTIRRVGVANRKDREPRVEPDALVAYDDAVAQVRALGLDVTEVPIAEFLAAGALLYGGALVAERTTSIGAHIASGASDIDPTVGSIVTGGATKTATDAYETEYRLIEFRSRFAAMWSFVDALVLPTTPGVATRAEVAADPVGVNARLGTFTTAANLLDLAVVCVPVGTRPDGLPAGVQIIGPAWTDAALCDVAAALLRETIDAATPRLGEQTIVVVGAHLSGMALHHQLASRGARLVHTTTTAPNYRLFALAGTVPPKPGLQRGGGDDGTAIAVEVWALAPSRFASFVAEIPPPLGIGKVELVDGSWHGGFVCEPIGFDGATDITSFGGWRAYIASTTAKSAQNGAVVR